MLTSTTTLETDFRAGSRLHRRAWTGIARAIPRTAVPTARVTLGLVFFVCGLNGFLDFLPHPTEPMSNPAMQFVGGLMASGYFIPLLKGTEVIAAVLLIANRFVPLALAVLAPIVINIVAFHVFLSPSGFLIPLVVLVLELFLVWSYRAAYRPMLAAKVSSASLRADADRQCATQ